MKRTSGLKKSGFTLIELLIVVAIIAILAAIAVPNFLEAQVRAKVSRGKSDMRSLAVALESYNIDTNKFPPGQLNIVGTSTCIPTEIRTLQAVKMGWAYSFLTTPVSYMTSIPRDPFNTQGGTLDLNNKNTFSDYYDYSSTGPNVCTYVQAKARMKAQGEGINWYIRSAGPSRHTTSTDPTHAKDWVLGGILGVISLDSWGYPDCFYDPSNGTTSWGQIVRSNRGIEPLQTTPRPAGWL